MYSTMALAVDVTVFLAAEDEFARDIYFAGIILMIMGIYTWIHVRLLYAGMLSASIIGVYMAIMVAHGSHNIPLLMGYLFFFCGAMIIGHMSQSLRLRFVLENKQLRRSLHQRLEEEGDARQRSDFAAQHHSLTALPNRAYLEQHVQALLQRAREQGSALALLFIDLDGFKPINDRHGH